MGGPGMMNFRRAFLLIVASATAVSQPPWNAECNPGTNVPDCNALVEGQQCVAVDWLGKFACSCPGDTSRGGHQCQNSCHSACGEDNPGCSGPCNYPRGECDLSIGACRCSAGYTGANCSLTCPGGGSSPCSGHGTCSADGDTPKCSCSEGWVGSDCSRTCLGGGSCSGHGVCIRSGDSAGSCRCSAGWRGAGCDVECPGGASNACSGHGTCSIFLGSRAQCTCDAGYGGATCSIMCPTFYDQPCGCSDATLSTCRGTCSSLDGTCACKSSYRGVSCGILCLGGPTNTCSRHGTCAEDGSCLCYRGWTGSMCETECPGGWQLPCSGHGVCSAQGKNSSRCDCDAGLDGLVGSYEGVSCEKAILNENMRVETSKNDTLQVEPFSGQPWPAGVIPLLAALVIASPWIQRLIKIYKDQKLQKLGTQIPDDLFEEGVNPLAQQASSRAEGSKARRRRRRRASTEFEGGSETGSVDASIMSASSSDLGSAQNSPQKARGGRTKHQHRSRSRNRSGSRSSPDMWKHGDDSPQLFAGVGTYHGKSPTMSSISGSRSSSIQNSPMSRSTPVRALAPVPRMSLDAGESGIKGDVDVATPLDVLQETEERPWTSLTAAGGPGGDESWRRGGSSARGGSRERIDSWRMAGELDGAVWRLGSDADLREGEDRSASAGRGLLGILESEGVNVD